MGIKEDFSVHSIPYDQTKSWILKKHYAHRMPSISHSYGLYYEDEIVGVCTFGYPPNHNYNNGKFLFKDYEVLTLELNRLITEDGLPKNHLSFFVARCLDNLPKPCAVVSYSDPNEGHHGYIYQATNWIYTGTSTPKHRYTFEDGTVFDIRRGIDKKIEKHGQIISKELLLPTYRYVRFVGNKRQINKMKKNFKLQSLPYPKGDNTEYDTSEKVAKKMRLVAQQGGTE